MCSLAACFGLLEWDGTSSAHSAPVSKIDGIDVRACSLFGALYFCPSSPGTEIQLSPLICFSLLSLPFNTIDLCANKSNKDKVGRSSSLRSPVSRTYYLLCAYSNGCSGAGRQMPANTLGRNSIQPSQVQFVWSTFDVDGRVCAAIFICNLCSMSYSPITGVLVMGVETSSGILRIKRMNENPPPLCRSGWIGVGTK